MLRLILICFFITLHLVQSSCPGGIKDSEVEAILNGHNVLRSTISSGKFVAKGKKMPAAKTPLVNLTWDCSIEKSAQTAADTCVFEHSTNRLNLGENLYEIYETGTAKLNSTTGVGKMGTEAWANEFQVYGWTSVNLTSEVFDTGVGHATQMAWADSTQIGCGISLCNDYTVIILNCQYRNAGNIINYNVYDPK